MHSSPNAIKSNVSGVAPDPSLNLNSIFPAVYFDGPDSKSSPFKLSKRLSSESIRVILDLSGKVSIIKVDPDGFTDDVVLLILMFNFLEKSNLYTSS